MTTANKTLKEFVAEIQNDGMARTNRFMVNMTLPPALQRRSSYGQKLQKILLFCDAVQLPGLSLSTTQARTFGEFREMPYEKLFENVNLSFYCDVDMHVKMLFDDWMSAIQNPEDRTIEYYKNYITDLYIDVYDINENQRYNVTLYEAYPKSIGAVQLDYAQKEVMKLQVGIQYKYWRSRSYDAGYVPYRDNRPFFSINGKTIGEYLNDFKAFQGRFNDYNNTFQNGNTLQQPSQNITTDVGSALNIGL